MEGSAPLVPSVGRKRKQAASTLAEAAERFFPSASDEALAEHCPLGSARGEGEKATGGSGRDVDATRSAWVVTREQYHRGRRWMRSGQLLFMLLLPVAFEEPPESTPPL